MSPTQSPVFFSDDLLTEFLSLLPVKSLLRFKCVSKSWNTLISDPNFVKFHLNRSNSRNPHLTLITHHIKIISIDEAEVDYSIVPYPIRRLLDNPSFTLVADTHHLLNEKDCSRIAGSCNGLICLAGDRFADGACYEYWLRLWNPTTRKISQKIGCFRDIGGFTFNFGCDNSTGTFKVVASRYVRDKLSSEVRVFSLGDNVWRNIQSYPVVPLYLEYAALEYFGYDRCVFFHGALNWLAIHDNHTRGTWYNKRNDITVAQLLIVSLDLGTETYNQYLLPREFDEVPPAEPTVAVLGDFLCFSYSYKETDFVIWQMKKFGDDESWTQFLKISYHDLQLDYDFSGETLKYHLRFVPLFLSKDGDTLILYISQESGAIIYNWRDNRVQRTGVTVHKTIIDNGTSNYLRWGLAKGYVESLISSF